MIRITNPIRLDREFRGASAALIETVTAKTPLPIVVNGLPGGANLCHLFGLNKS